MPELVFVAALMGVSLAAGILIGVKLSGRRVVVVEVPAPYTRKVGN